MISDSAMAEGGLEGGESDSDDLSKESALKKKQKLDHDDDDRKESVEEEESKNNSQSDSNKCADGALEEDDREEDHDENNEGEKDSEEKDVAEKEKEEEQDDDWWCDDGGDPWIWEVDSDSESDSDSDSESGYVSEEFKEQFRQYNKQIIESRGFDVDFVPNASFFGGVRPVDLEDDNSLYVKWGKECVAVAIKQYNEKNVKRANLQLESILKANHGPAAGRIFYITFQARKSSSGRLLTYQTKVFWGRKDEHVIEVLLFRLKPEAKAAN